MGLLKGPKVNETDKRSNASFLFSISNSMYIFYIMQLDEYFNLLCLPPLYYI